jgi:hypothetical protein
VLNSRERPPRFRLHLSRDAADYDPAHLGWRYDLVAQPPNPGLPPREARQIVDTSQFGKGNGGHQFGDDLNDQQRTAVIEYLKTL